jgi:hypothetical protein
MLSLASAFLALLTPTYLLDTIVAAVILPLASLAICLLRGCRWKPNLSEVRYSSVVFLCLAVYLGFFVALYWSTPYYPMLSASDFLRHAEITQDIFNLNGRSILLHTNYVVGLHFAAAILMELLGVAVIQSLRTLISFVLMANLVLIFVVAQALLGNKSLAAVSTIVGALVLPVDLMHNVLIGTYPNILADGLVFAMLFFIFSYAKQPSVGAGLTLAMVAIAGAFIHSSFLLFLGVLWIAFLGLHLFFRKKLDPVRYVHACLFGTSGVIIAALVALPLYQSVATRILGSYFLSASATWPQLIALLPLMYQITAYNFVFLVKPINLLMILVGIVFIVLKQRDSIGRLFASAWIIMLVTLAFVSGQTDRFVLFCMLPAVFIVGNLVGSLPNAMSSWKRAGSRILNTGTIVPLALLLLVGAGGFLPLASVVYSPSNRVHEQNIIASMTWLQQNVCPKAVASLGLGLDYRYLPILTNIQYSGALMPTTPPNQVLRESGVMGFGCVVIQTDNPNFQSFELNQAFQERYRNPEVAIFFITS